MSQKYLIIFLFISIIVFGCYGLKEGKHSRSNNIYQSKMIGVFLKEYVVENISFNDGSLVIEEVWLENEWLHGRTENKPIIKKDYYQLVIRVKEFSPDSLNGKFYFQIENPAKNYSILFHKYCNIGGLGILPQNLLYIKLLKCDDIVNNTPFEDYGYIELSAKSL